MARYTVEPLRPDTWEAFARLAERHNGVWGGCWCLSFHPKFPERGQSVEGNRALKQRLVNRDYRRESVSAAALRGALDLIAESGGGVVEAYPQDTQGEKVSASFLYNGTRSLFEHAGFEYERPKGKNHCVMRTTIART